MDGLILLAESFSAWGGGDSTITLADLSSSDAVYICHLCQLKAPDKEDDVSIAGLWALDFPVNEYPKSDPGKLYFTAGPMEESHGLFGFLKMQ